MVVVEAVAPAAADDDAELVRPDAVALFKLPVLELVASPCPLTATLVLGLASAVAPAVTVVIGALSGSAPSVVAVVSPSSLV